MNDRHLNLFYSYNQGNLDNLERTKQLENNLTRALISTLRNLSKETQHKIISKLINIAKIDSGKFLFDLQNKDKKISFKNEKKFLLILQGADSGITKGSLKQKNEKLLNPDFNDKEKREIIHELERCFAENTPYEKSDYKIEHDELKSYIDLIHGNIPDGWIIGDKEVVLIETKIGNNKALNEQIYRHLTGEKGFMLSKDEIAKGDKSNAFQLINLTWKDLVKVFNEVDTKRNTTDEFLKNELIKYITMTGQILDLKFILEKDKGYDRDTAIEQFPKLLQELDKKVDAANLGIANFQRKGKGARESYLWDYYGTTKKNKDGKDEVQQDPHYSIYFDVDGVGIALTTKDEKGKKELLQNQNLITYIQTLFDEKDKGKLTRYSLGLSNYRLIDYKKGMIKGEVFTTFQFIVNLSELYNNKTKIEKGKKENQLMQLTKYMLDCSRLGKQAEFRLMITYPSIKYLSKENNEEDSSQEKVVTKESASREENKKFFQNHDLLLNLFVEFINATKDIYTDLLNNKIQKMEASRDSNS